MRDEFDWCFGVCLHRPIEMSRITIVQGPGAGRTIDQSDNGVVIGRQPGLEVTLDSGAISRRHARLTWEGDRVFVEDLKSSNGTFINEVRITGRTPLGPGDTLRIGSSILQWTKVEPRMDLDMTIQRQTVVATSNAELFQDHAGIKLQAVLGLAHQLANAVDTDTVLDRLLDQLLILFPHAERALVLLREGDEPVLRAMKNRGGRPAHGPLFSRSVLRKVFAQGVAVLAGDTRHEQSFMANMTLSAMGTQSLLCVPLQSNSGRVFGALQLDRFQAGQPFTADDLYLLTAVTLMVSTVLENAQLYQELMVKERMQRDLAMAREIQLGYLPKEAVVLAGGPFELIAELHPALEVSGDFYDYFPLDEHRLAFAVADVSGKGVAAALFMTLVHALGRHLAQGATSPADFIALLNDAIARDNPNFLFVTMVFGIYDSRTGQVTLAHGGHPPALVRRKDGRVEELTHRGAALMGIQKGLRRGEEAVIQLSPGDAIVLYTDGVTESPGLIDLNELFGSARLAEAVRCLPANGPLSDWTLGIREAVARFSGAESVADDITLLVLRRPEQD